jgi:hypothetical protein
VGHDRSTAKFLSVKVLPGESRADCSWQQQSFSLALLRPWGQVMGWGPFLSFFFFLSLSFFPLSLSLSLSLFPSCTGDWTQGFTFARQAF